MTDPLIKSERKKSVFCAKQFRKNFQTKFVPAVNAGKNNVILNLPSASQNKLPKTISKLNDKSKFSRCIIKYCLFIAPWTLLLFILPSPASIYAYTACISLILFVFLYFRFALPLFSVFAMNFYSRSKHSMWLILCLLFLYRAWSNKVLMILIHSSRRTTH